MLWKCETFTRCKVSHTLADLTKLLGAIGITITSNAGKISLELAKTLVSYLPNNLILAKAIQTNPERFLSHDQQHLLEVKKESFTFHGEHQALFPNGSSKTG